MSSSKTATTVIPTIHRLLWVRGSFGHFFPKDSLSHRLADRRDTDASLYQGRNGTASFTTTTRTKGDTDDKQGDSDALCQEESTSSGDPLYALVAMIQKLKQKRTANELYVRKVLRDQVGLSEHDLATFFDHTHAYEMRRLSVKQNVEPVVSYLRSIGIVGSALVDMIVREPLILRTSVDDLFLIYEWIEHILSHSEDSASAANPTSLAPAVLLKCPRLATDISPQDLRDAAQTFKTSCVRRMIPIETHQNLLKTFLWEYPDQFCEFVKDTREHKDIDHIVKALSVKHTSVGHPSMTME